MTALILLSDWQKSQVEIWLPIQGFEGYDVSNFGRVRSYWQRMGGRKGFQLCMDLSPSILKFGVHKQGYLITYLYRANEKRKTLMVHRLVAQAFIHNPNGLPEVNHITGLKSDCRSAALEWSTRATNQQHAWAVGLITVKMVQEGLSRTVNSDFTEEQIIEIRNRRADGETNAALAKVYGVTDSAICCIVTGKTFKRTGGPRTTGEDFRRLTLDDVRAIRQEVKNGITQAELSGRFNIAQSEISRVVHAQRRYANMV